MGTMKNALVTATNWHEMILVFEARPAVIKVKGIAKLWPHLGSSLKRKKAGPSQNKSHAIPRIRIPLPAVITLSTSIFKDPTIFRT